MQVTQSIDVLLLEIFSEHALLYAVLSAPKAKGAKKHKISIRPIKINDTLQYQVTSYEGTQAFHKNLEAYDCRMLIGQQLQQEFKQALICTEKADYHILVSQSNKMTILKKPPSRSSSKSSLEHNRAKEYILEEGKPIPFLVELGIMTQQGQVIAKKMDKFRQLNRFLELIRDVIPQLDLKHTIHIVDFGCGKAYLTFALYHYLVNIMGLKLDIQGLDLKEEVITQCQKLSETLEYSGLHFAVGDISHYSPKTEIDLVITLHACDTATDAALAQAIRWDVSVILSVPCCQHELFGQIRNSELAPLLRHGILKERFASLATDAARAQLLDIAGYQTQILEFIDLEHTPKNLLIRAIKRTSKQTSSEAMQDYKIFKEALGISPALENMLNDQKK